MATLISNTLVDMSAWNMGALRTGTYGNQSETAFTIEVGGHEFAVTGSGFTFGASGKLTGGTITGLAYRVTGASTDDYALSALSLDAAAFIGAVKHDAGDPEASRLQHSLLAGDDTLGGSAEGDTLRGMGGDDSLVGGEGGDTLRGGWGDDTLKGGVGADVMRGGRGHNSFVYDNAADSGGGVYDTIEKFSTRDDKVVLAGVTVSGIDATVDAGTSATANVDSNLATALDAAHLGIAHAALATVTVTGGPGPETYLVVDMNGVAGYQAGEDLAIRLVDSSNLDSLSIDTFGTI